MRRLVEITFMSLDGVIDAPDITQQAAEYFSGDKEHDAYQKERLFAADVFDSVDVTTHLALSDVRRFASVTMVLEYTPKA